MAAVKGRKEAYDAEDFLVGKAIEMYSDIARSCIRQSYAAFMHF